MSNSVRPQGYVCDSEKRHCPARAYRNTRRRAFRTPARLCHIVFALSGVLGLPRAALAQEGSAAPAAAERPTFQMMRYDEDWSRLADPAQRTEPLDRLKWIPLGPDTSLTLGGEARLRVESYDRFDLGLGNAPKDIYALGRLMLHGDLRFGNHVRAFAQFRYGGVSGERFPLGPVQDNDVDLNQAFVDLKLPAAEGRATVRLGRQEMLFGSGRMVAPRDGPNVRLSFDGVRGFYEAAAGWRVDAFYTRPVLPQTGAFDDKSSRGYEFWGTYATTPVKAVPGLGLDLYYLGLKRDFAAFAQGAGPETRHTIGGRVFGRSGAWDWDLEAAYQFGQAAGADIRAYTLANDIGYTIGALPWTPRVGLRVDLASGDDNLADHRLGTFEVPFPKLPYLIEANFIAPANIVDVHPTLSLALRPDLTVNFDYIALWKHRSKDTFYLPPLRPVPETENGGRFLGHFLQAGVHWDVMRQFSMDLSYARGIVSDYLQRTGARDSDFFMLVTTARF